MPPPRPPVPPAAPRASTLLAVMALLSLVWGSTWLVIAEGLDDLPSLTSAGVRFALAALIMAAIAPRLARAEGGAPPTRRLVVTMGTLSFAIPYGLVYWAETRLPSGLVALLWAVFPLMMGAAGHLWLGERLGGRQWLALLVGLGGGALILAGVGEVGAGGTRAGRVDRSPGVIKEP